MTRHRTPPTPAFDAFERMVQDLDGLATDVYNEARRILLSRSGPVGPREAERVRQVELALQVAVVGASRARELISPAKLTPTGETGA